MIGLMLAAETTTSGSSVDPTALLAWLTCLVTLAGCVVAILKWGRKIMQMVDDFNGTNQRPGVPERPGVMARLQTLDEKVAAVHAEVNYNHGTTIKDAVSRIETDLKGVHDRMDRQGSSS